MLQNFGLEARNIFHWNRIEVTLGAEENRDYLILDRVRRVLRLLEQLDQPSAAFQLRLGRRIQIRGESGESLELAVLRQLQSETACNLFHCLDLGSTADAGHRDTDVDGRPHTLVEQVGLQEALPVGDRDHVGRDERRDVAGLGLDDRQPGHRSAAELVRELCTALQQPRMQVEHVAGEGLATGWAAQQQRDGAVGVGLLGEIIEHDEHVLAVVHPVLTDRRPRVRSQPFEARGVGRGSGDDRGVLHRAALFERSLDTGDRGALLADRDVHAAHLLLGIAGLPCLTLVEDGVDADRGLAGLAVADDQLTLSAPDRGLRVDCLDAGLQRLGHTLALNHRRRLKLQHAAGVGLDVALCVDRLTEWVDDTTEERIPHRHREHFTRALDLLPLFDLLELAEDHDADAVLIEVHRHPEHTTGELEEFLGHDRGQALDVCDAVTCVDDGADLFALGVGGERGDVVLDGTFDIRSGDCQLSHGSWSSYL